MVIRRLSSVSTGHFVIQQNKRPLHVVPEGVLNSYEKVSIHASARDATSFSAPSLLSFAFQSTRPRGTRHVLDDVYQEFAEFQSTRPRGTRPHPQPQPQGLQGVSIHASARDATINTIDELKETLVSIHASARDATAGTGTLTLACLFQSTRPRGTRPTPADF